jgi:carboxypeptidase C (cathepsin A)
MQRFVMRRFFVYLRTGLVGATVLRVMASASLCAQTPQPTPTQPPRPAKPDEKAEEFQPPPPITTEHTLTLPAGKTLKYKAITGYLLLTDSSKPDGTSEGPGKPESEASPDKAKEKPVDPAKGKPKAQVFYVAYVATEAGDPANRPLTFVFNGGPGSSAVWLHLGGVGPRRVLLSDQGEALPPPARLVDNESTWLDKTDLVFVDPVPSGYSRPAPGENARQFWGYSEDIRHVGDFIRLWTTKNSRWASPKFLAGESYGTTRAAGLGDYLQDRYAMSLNGIVLIGSVLNFQTIEMSYGNDVPYPLFLPSYASAAWYHKKLSPELQQLSLPDLLKRVEDFAGNTYLVALAKGDALSTEEQKSVADQLARFTGLDPTYLLQQNLREPDDRFFVDLLKKENRSIGRYDTRFTGIRYYPGTDRPDFDPSDLAVDGPFTAAFYDYVRRDLKYESDLPYERFAEARPWLYSKDRYLDVAENLRKIMSRNPYLKVMVCCGYYDLATPYFAAVNVTHSMNLDPAIRRNLQVQFYESGHMLYIDSAARKKLDQDFDQFVDGALSAAPVSNASREGQ